MRQIKYLNNIVEQDHRVVKRLARPMLGVKTFWSAPVTLAGIEIMHMIRKGQLRAVSKLRQRSSSIRSRSRPRHSPASLSHSESLRQNPFSC